MRIEKSEVPKKIDRMIIIKLSTPVKPGVILHLGFSYQHKKYILEAILTGPWNKCNDHEAMEFENCKNNCVIHSVHLLYEAVTVNSPMISENGHVDYLPYYII